MKWVEGKTEGAPPAARGGHAGVSLERSCYYFGGADRNLKVYDEVVKCNLTGHGCAWEKVKLAIESNQGCRSRTGCSSTVIGNDMYIFAGQDPHSGTLFNDVFKVDLRALKLQRVEVKGGSPPPRHSHTSVPLNEKCMLVFGGAGREAPLNDTWIFDTESLCWTYPAVTGEIPRVREMHSACTIGKHVVVYGGRDNEGRVLQDLHLLDVEKMEWEKKMVTDFPRCAHSCVAVKFQDTCVSGVVTSSEEGEEEGKAQQEGLIIFAGFSGTQVENSVLFVPKDFSTVLDVSSQVTGSPPTPSFAHVGLPIQNEAGFTEALVSFGGINLSQDTNEVSILSFV